MAVESTRHAVGRGALLLDRLVAYARPGRRARFLAPSSKVATGQHGVGMVGAEDACLIFQQVFQCLDGSRCISGLTMPGREVSANAEGFGVVVAEHANVVREHGLQGFGGSDRISHLTASERNIVAGCEGP